MFHPSNYLYSFDGAIITRLNPLSTQRSFEFEVTFHPHLWPRSLVSQKPPLHFHPHQEEYIQVVEGSLCVEIEGSEQVLTPADGELCVKPWLNHRLYPPNEILKAAAIEEGVDTTNDTTAGRDRGNDQIKFLLAGEETAKSFRLDTIFFENWYGYQDEVILGGKRMDLIQVMCVCYFGSYIHEWVLFIDLY